MRRLSRGSLLGTVPDFQQALKLGKQAAIGMPGCFDYFFGDGGKGGEHVGEIVFGDVVEVREGGVEFRAELNAFGFAPFVDAAALRTGEAAGGGEGFHVVGGAGELEDALADPVFEGFALGPSAFFG